MTDSPSIEPADGKLGILCVGLGAVTSTLIAGVELSKQGLAEPIGSLTQMGTIRLGKRTDDRVPLISDFVPLASLDDVVFGAWDPYPDDAYAAASRAGVLESAKHLEPVADVLRQVEPMPAAFDPSYVGICHLCNDIFTRPETRDVLHANAWKARDRIAMHRSFLEAARADKELSGLYVKS